MKSRYYNFLESSSRLRTPLGVSGMAAIIVAAGVAQAADFTWNTASGNWNIAASWVTGDPPVAGTPTATDNAYFSNNTGDPSIGSAPVVVSLNGSNRAINSMTFQSPGTTTITPGSGDRNLSVFSGITVNSGAGAVTIGTATNTNGVTLGANQTWTNNGSLSITNSINPRALTAEETSITLTITGSGATALFDTARIRNAITLVKEGAGTLSLSGPSPTNYNYTGGLSVKAGTLSIGAINNSGSNGFLGNSTTPVVLGDTGTSTGTLSYTGATAASNKLFILATDGTGAFEVTAAATALTLSGVIDGTGTLQKKGDGALVLTGTKTYTGPTSITGGSLRVNGSIDVASAVTVSGGTLAGTGTVNGTTSVAAGGTVAPGTLTTIGQLSTANVTFTSGAVFDVDIDTNSTSVDLLNVTGDLNLGGATLVTENLGTAAPTSFAVFTIATYTGTRTGTFNGLPEGAKVPIGGRDYTIKYADGGNSITLTAPEVIGTPYDAWALQNITSIDPTADATPTGNPDNDGANNLAEYAFNGNPLSGSDDGQIHVSTADTNLDSTKELVLTVAVLAGAPEFTGNPSPTATVAGITYTIQGSTTLGTFDTKVNVVPIPVTTELPGAGTGYEYRSFSLDGSSGLAGKGFLRAQVGN